MQGVCALVSDPRDVLSWPFFPTALISFQRARNVGLRPKEPRGKKAGKSVEDRGRSSLRHSRRFRYLQHHDGGDSKGRIRLPPRLD